MKYSFHCNESCSSAVFGGPWCQRMLLCVQTSRLYCAANTEDLEFVVDHVNTALPEAPVMGVGISLGG